MVDTRTYDCGYDMLHRGGVIKAGEPVHDMWLRFTIDLDFLLHDSSEKRTSGIRALRDDRPRLIQNRLFGRAAPSSR